MCKLESRSRTGSVESSDIEDTVIVTVVCKAKIVECTMCQLYRFKCSIRIDTEPGTCTCVECRVDEFNAVHCSLASEVEAVAAVTANVIYLNTVILDRADLRSL